MWSFVDIVLQVAVSGNKEIQNSGWKAHNIHCKHDVWDDDGSSWHQKTVLSYGLVSSPLLVMFQRPEDGHELLLWVEICIRPVLVPCHLDSLSKEVTLPPGGLRKTYTWCSTKYKPFILLLLLRLFIQKPESHRERKKREREREIFLLLAHLPNGHISWGWARPNQEPGTTSRFPMWVAGTQHLSCHLLSPRPISRQLHWKQTNQHFN